MCINFDTDNNYIKDSYLPIFFNNQYLYLNKNNHLILESNFDYTFKDLPDFTTFVNILNTMTDLEKAKEFAEVIEKLRNDYDLQQYKYSKIADNQIQILDFKVLNIIQNTDSKLDKIEFLIKILKTKDNTNTINQIALDTLYNFSKSDNYALALFDTLVDKSTLIQTKIVKQIEKENHIAEAIRLSLIYN
ncbi:hypothetical protein ABHA52_10595 [Enterococcus faecium]|uniref:hypothetical protein n=1 Tax=Enterococcus faecium TaxID=1352 RepID=UPI001106BC60|nr:hypothetical protein [Enterococcus faecium]MDB7484789.1 hypothetical protein [Enterococcus faecium]MDB7489817.1 hypothetical protein [Enterococcus faecium]MDB7492405.1 hypothetical protein [Enterococcus faecium]MDB7495023.1 hypothetical protein [Enterococcus faecium]MDB7497483.1 hypothetical protein [Enterococcus faecium]